MSNNRNINKNVNIIRKMSSNLLLNLQRNLNVSEIKRHRFSYRTDELKSSIRILNVQIIRVLISIKNLKRAKTIYTCIEF